MTRFILADAHAFGVVAIGPEGRGACGADPFIAPLMAAFLFLEPFAQRLHQLVKTACGLDLGLFLGGEVLFGHFLQPLVRDVHGLHHIVEADVFEAREGSRKGAVELVDVAFVFDHAGAREIVEGIDIIGREPRCHPVEKGEKFAHGHRHLVLAQLVKERQKHELRSG